MEILNFIQVLSGHIICMQCIDVAYCYRCRTWRGLCVGVLGIRYSCVKTAEPIEIPFGGLTHVGPRNPVLDGVKTGRIHSPP